MSEPVVVGRINGVFGTRGWVKVISYTRPRDNLMAYRPWFLRQDSRWREYPIKAVRRHHGGLIAELEGIADRDLGAALVGSEIGVNRAQFGATDEGEYFWSDLIGLKVVNADGETLGTVAGLLETPAHDVLRVRGERERLIPFVRDVYVTEVAVGAGEIRVDWHADD